MTLPLADEILRHLLESGGTPVSGQRLAEGLGVTRAAVWKGVEALRAQGYDVESLPSRGYRYALPPRGLRPAEIAARLCTRRLGRPARQFAEVDSTSRECERWAQEGAPEGALVVAEHQEAGRGRLGRQWLDAPGKSLLFSIVLRPTLPASEAPLLTYAAAVALARAVARWVPKERVEIKWPNDLLVDGRKLAGILLDLKAEAQRVEHVVLGVGVNVAGMADDLPEEVRERAASLGSFVTPPPGRLDVLCSFLEEFEPVYDEFLRGGLEPLRRAWNGWFRMAGERVRVATGRGPIEGVARGLGPGGALLLDGAEGPLEIYAGDLELATLRAP